MKTWSLVICIGLALGGWSCKSKPKDNTLTGQFSAAFDPNVSIGSYYKTKGLSTAFYDTQPDSLIGKTPSDLLGRGHVVQLLDPSAGGGWARVRNDEDEIGFIRFDKLKIVPFEDQPLAPKRKNNKERWE
jgi:hypothetical protein